MDFYVGTGPMPAEQANKMLKIQTANLVQVVNSSPNAPALREALAAALIDNPGTFGKRIYNPLNDQHIDTFKYTRPTAGATTVVTMADPSTGDVYVALGQKHKDPKNPAAGLGEFIAPGGYMDAKPPSNAHPQDMQRYDRNLEDTARRELAEEMGVFIPENIKPTSLGVDSEEMNNRHCQSVNEFKHFALQGSPAFMPLKAGDDLASAQWVKATDIIENAQIGPQGDGSPQSRFQINTPQGVVNLRDLHGSYIKDAVQAAQQELLATSRNVPSNDNLQVAYTERMIAQPLTQQQLR